MTAHVKKKWFLLSSGEVLAALTATTDGLTPNEAAGRLAAAGANELEQAKPINPFLILVRQFQSLIVWILLAAAIVSAILGEWLDFSAIIFIVFLNAVIGFYQEFNAEQSLAALKKMTSPHAKVKRAKQIVSLPAAQLVTGDVIQLEPGDLVPADARLLKTASLQCVEAALTGESTSVRKVAATLKDPATALGDRFNMAFMGTVVTAGTAEAVVVETGMRTQIGHIAGLIKEAASEEGTPLQRKLDVVGRILIWASLGIVTILFILGLVRGLNFLDLFMISVSLAVAAVPEGLPAVVTVALALGVKRMAQRRALVRRLPSVEAMGSVTVICTDKTGTLTVGEMTVRKLYVAESSYTVTGEGYEPVGEILLNGRPPDTKQAAQVRELGKIFASCNNATLTQEKHNWKVIGDTTEGALLIAASKIGLSRTTIEEQCPRQFELPFNSDRKRASVVRIMASDRQVAFVNGAPDVLLGLCTQIY
ncbi:MAG: HAD-IC family P-type ATPase, partial [Candidatus Obscuribacterales bacterium]|nr:HAD-IC family P-type ATPase [Candidatus Obscuribacterales bacterium]